MIDLFGSTRTVVTSRYALITPDGFVSSNLPGWRNCTVVSHISPVMGARFVQLMITFGSGGTGEGHSGRSEYFFYVLKGKCAGKAGAQAFTLNTGGYAFIPPATQFAFTSADEGTQLAVFQKVYEPLEGAQVPAVIIGDEHAIPGQAFLGNENARLQVLLPDQPDFDMAVNIFTYQPGATLPFVETHVMEHGMLMVQGQGIYRLDNDWHPVKQGDVIWMASYCPQWFVAMGDSPAGYIYYKDVNRALLAQ